MKIKKTITIIIGFIIAITSPFAAIAENETPHNTSKTVSCGNCHGKTLLYSPFWGGSYAPQNIDDTVYNKICLECHKQSSGPYSTTGAPLARTHSSLATDNGYGDWKRECRDCHNPHYQKQSLFKRTDSSNLYLASGTITTCGAYNSVNNTTTLGYSGITYKTGWDSAKLLEKTGTYRRTMLVPNVGKLGFNYPVKAIDATTITVEGNATAAYQYKSPPTTFAVMYGQYVKDLINVSGTNMTVKLLDKTGAKSFADGDTTYDGVCEVCHTQTTHFRNNGGGSDPKHTNLGSGIPGTNCISCHTHPEGFKASCNACHGFPPVVNSATSPDGLVWVSPVTGSATAGAHDLHVNTKSYQCDTCHYQNITQNKHNKDPRVITLGFYMFSGAYQGGSYDGQSSPNYEATTTSPATSVTKTGSKTCSSLYCHGGTMAPNGGTASAVWNVPASADCGTCHGASTGSPPLRGSHPKHAGSASGGRQLACTVCHSGYTSVHVNGSANWAYDTTTYSWLSGALYRGSASGSATPVPSASYGDCTNLYCHSQGTSNTSPYPAPNIAATWGGALDDTCTGCHSGDKNATNKIASGSHTKHIVDSSMDCTKCHNQTASDSRTISNQSNHVNNLVNVAYDAASNPSGNGTYNGTVSPMTKTPGTPYAQCTNIYCHGSGTPTWDGAAIPCDGCHKASNILQGKHGVHYESGTVATNRNAANNSSGTTYIYNCGVCHDPGATAHAGGAVSSIQAAQIAFDSTYAGGGTYTAGGTLAGTDNTFNWTAGACTNTYCHSPGTKFSSPYDAPNVTAFNWNSAAGTLQCNGCHGNAPSYTSGSPKTNSHSKHSYGCNKCHVNTTSDGTTITTAANHVNIAYNVDAGAGASFTYVFNVAGGTCSSISCHYNGTAQWGATLTCSSCHGFPPNTNAHYAHTDAAGAALLTQVYGSTEVKSNAANYAFGCGNCHPTSSSSHANGAVEISMNPSDGGILKSKNDLAANRTGTGGATVCNKIYCHSNGAGSTASNIAAVVSPAWNATLTGNKCGACHGNPPQYASAGAGIAGANSHYNATGFMGKEGGHMLTVHRDNVYNKVAGTGLLSTGTTVDSSHGNASVATTMACYVCHSGVASSTTIDTYAMNGTGSSFRCGACHATPQAGVIDDKSKHVSGSVTVAFAPITMKSKAQLRTASLPAGWTRSGTYGASGSYDFTSATLSSGTWAPATKTCTVACHNGNLIQWGDTTATCLSCHDRL